MPLEQIGNDPWLTGAFVRGHRSGHHIEIAA
jgi:hypothetical protein